jgi:hypothetical protein
MTSRISSKMARPLGVRGHQKRSHLVAGQKLGGAVFVETQDEIVTLLCLEVDPRVKSAAPQPFTVRLDIEQVFATRSEAVQAAPRQRPQAVTGDTPPEQIYTPDFLAELVTGEPWVIESKSTAAVSKTTAALQRRSDVLNRLGFHFLVIPGEELQARGLHANLVHLRDAMRLQQQGGAGELLRQLETVVAAQPEVFDLGAIKAALPATAIYLGIVNGLIACDLKSGNLGTPTKLWRAHGDLSHLQLLKLES